MVARLHARDTLADGLDDAGSLVPEDDGECALGVFAGEGVGICGGDRQPYAALVATAGADAD